MKFFFPLIAAPILCCISSSAQSKYNKITMDEMDMTSYASDTTAAAVVLLKDAKLNFIFDAQYGFRYELSISVKMKILKTEGLDYANQELSYTKISRGQEEVINSLSGTTYNLENGKIVKTKLTKEHIFDSSQDNEIFLKKFTMPAAKVGSVIEYKYTKVSDFYYEMPSFSFQESIPVEYVSYRVVIPEWFRYNVNTTGYVLAIPKITPVNETLVVQGNHLQCQAEEKLYILENVPALKSEPYVWNIDDYRSQVTFELQSTQFPQQVVRFYTSTWPEIDKKLLENSKYGGSTKKSGLFKDEISIMDQTKENAQQVLNLIKTKVKWDGKNRFLASDNLKNILKDGVGTSADMNFLYINALKAAGFEAFPVMLSTRDNGRLPIANPSLTNLNYTLTAIKVDSVIFYTDASAKYGDLNLLPSKCMVTQARVFDPAGSYWVDLSRLSSGTAFILANFDYKEDGLDGTIKEERIGNEAYDFRRVFFESHKDKEEYIEKKSSNIGFQITDFELDGEQDPSEKIIATMNVHKDATLEDEFLYINPLVYKVFDENPFKSEKRIYPIQFDYISSFVEMVNITIPEGYSVEELPQSARFVFGDDRSIMFTYAINNVGDKISINYQLQMKTLLILPDDYEVLKEFFAKIVAKNNEQVVLKKI